MPSQVHHWIVDRIAATAASVEVDGDAVITVPPWLLPASAREGDVLRVTHDRPANGPRTTLTIEVDPAATHKALTESATHLAKARTQNTDPGGDITL